MRIAIQNPIFLAEDQSRNFNGYDLEFFQLIKPIIYVTKPSYAPIFRKKLIEKGMQPEDFEFALTMNQLNAKADVLLCFQGRSDLDDFKPPSAFLGMKLFHVKDYVFRAKEANEQLERGGVDRVMGYTYHDRYCPFFQTYYPSYAGKVIPVPFGFAKRFVDETPFSKRINKVVGVGSVNPVNDPLVSNPDDLREYTQFYADTVWTHGWRRKLVEHKEELKEVLDSRYPEFPVTKDSAYDAVGVLNQYAMFANDEGLMAMPPARTYEGVAAGSVMVSAQHPCFEELGFVDGVNCIMHPKHDLGAFQEKVKSYQRHPEQLEKIAREGKKLVRTRYTHEEVAKSLFKTIQQTYKERG